jgi:hypothetical protein
MDSRRRATHGAPAIRREPVKKTTTHRQHETPNRKLRLDRETVRQLDAEALRQAGGGLDDTIVRPSDACGTPTSH